MTNDLRQIAGHTHKTNFMSLYRVSELESRNQNGSLSPHQKVDSLQAVRTRYLAPRFYLFFVWKRSRFTCSGGADIHENQTIVVFGDSQWAIATERADARRRSTKPLDFLPTRIEDVAIACQSLANLIRCRYFSRASPRRKRGGTTPVL